MTSTARNEILSQQQGAKAFKDLLSLLWPELQPHIEMAWEKYEDGIAIAEAIVKAHPQLSETSVNQLCRKIIPYGTNS